MILKRLQLVDKPVNFIFHYAPSTLAISVVAHTEN